ncbi:hypothetical protein BDN67DRAFT_984772 [Paxillus ammoniavirescens]|nr:hypothetical protein BDN67DRAFT_984772 [Paxillus ammoniavirescens]
MSYLIGGRDYYTNATFKTVHFYNFINMVTSYMPEENNEGTEETITLTCQKGSVKAFFMSMLLWEYIEQTEKSCIPTASAPVQEHEDIDFGTNDSDDRDDIISDKQIVAPEASNDEGLLGCSTGDLWTTAIWNIIHMSPGPTGGQCAEAQSFS